MNTLALDINSTDVVIQISGTSVQFHSCILYCRWPAYSDPIVMKNLASLQAIQASTVKHLKRFIYCDDLPGTLASSYYEDNAKLSQKEIVAILAQLMVRSSNSSFFLSFFSKDLMLLCNWQTIAQVGNYRRLYERIELLLLELGIAKGQINKEFISLVTQHKSLVIENYSNRLAALAAKPQVATYVSGSDLSKDLAYLYKTAQFSGDFELVLADGNQRMTLKFHKAILLARWPYIATKYRGKNQGMLRRDSFEIGQLVTKLVFLQLNLRFLR